MEEYIASGLIRNVEKWAPHKDDLLARADFFKSMSENPILNEKTLRRYKDESWCAKSLVRNPSFSFGWIDIVPDIGWNWQKLSAMNPTIDIVRKYSHAPWDWVQVSLSDGITFTDMTNNRDLPWVIEEVLFRSITCDDEIEYLRTFATRYDFYAWVDHSERVSWDIFKKNMDLPWSLYHIHPVVKDQTDLDIIMSNPYLWNWIEISKNASIDLILKNKGIRGWVWSIVSLHEELEYHHVIENPDIPWSYGLVPIEEFDERLARKWIAASKIKRAFKRAMSNPLYKRCRDRLLEEWGEMNINTNVA